MIVLIHISSIIIISIITIIIYIHIYTHIYIYIYIYISVGVPDNLAVISIVIIIASKINKC